MKCTQISKSTLISSFSQLFISVLVLKTLVVIGEEDDELREEQFREEMDKLEKNAKHDFEYMDRVYYPTFPPNIKLSYIGQKMVDFKIIPDYMPLPPKQICNVTYPYDVFIEPGMNVELAQVKDEPNVTWYADKDKLYTLSMINMDRSLKKEAPWLVVNIPGNDVSKGTVIRHHYVPHVRRGRNRHVFLVFEQEKPINVTWMEDDTNIHYVFHMRSIAATYGLNHPKAGNFFCLPLNYTNELDFFEYPE